MGLISFVVGGILDANKAIKQKSAQNNDETSIVTIDNKYSIEVPAFLSPTKNLSEDASIQYWNKTLDITFQVIEEDKHEFIEAVESIKLSEDDSLLDAFATLVLANMYGSIENIEIEDKRIIEINGLPSLRIDVFQKRTFFKDAVYTSFAFIEGKNSLYQIIIMTGGTSISKLSEKLESSIYSFKEL